MIKKIYNYLFNNKLTFNDYLKYKNNMWEHYCEIEKDIIGIEKDKQYQNFSQIYFNKIKLNTQINEF